jgi:hypothetical protein
MAHTPFSQNSPYKQYISNIELYYTMTREYCTIGYFEWDKPSLIRFILTSEEPTMDQLEEQGVLFQQVMDNLNGKFVFIFDATQGKWLYGENRIRWALIIKDLEQKYADRYVRNYLIIPNLMIRMMLTGLNLVLNPTVPQVIYRTLKNGLNEAKSEVTSW